MNKISTTIRKYKLKRDASGFCLKEATACSITRKLLYYKVRRVLCENATNVMRKRDKCYAKTRQVLCENATSVMRKRDKCYAKMRQVLQRAKSVTKRHDCFKVRQNICARNSTLRFSPSSTSTPLPHREPP